MFISPCYISLSCPSDLDFHLGLITISFSIIHFCGLVIPSHYKKTYPYSVYGIFQP